MRIGRQSVNAAFPGRRNQLPHPIGAKQSRHVPGLGLPPTHHQRPGKLAINPIAPGGAANRLGVAHQHQATHLQLPAFIPVHQARQQALVVSVGELAGGLFHLPPAHLVNFALGCGLYRSSQPLPRAVLRQYLGRPVQGAFFAAAY